MLNLEKFGKYNDIYYESPDVTNCNPRELVVQFEGTNY